MNNIRFGLEDGGKTYVNTKKWHGICFRSLIQKNYLTTYNTKYKKSKIKLYAYSSICVKGFYKVNILKL